MQDAVADFRVVEPDRPTQLRIEASPWIHGDPHGLMQVVSNLLANARVHTPADTLVEVTLRATPTATAIEVRDHGPGIEGPELAHLFEAFYRTDPARSRANGGAGLGLTIASGIVESMGGSLTVESVPGAGATFTITIPRIATDDVADELTRQNS